ncbi:outer membrane beta-barrel protein [Sediminibacterium sp.]|uniref:outer membrane beta-barrel protein n=1 Tax=Sediminibacterium sp. TaxID=1917865 RepID=UPI002735C943|nr:outer membrane beta-barrel protein [Sediminibacterium sp.]MDP3393425.1 outer membrane beta-barrel protein [Sediminibacterium sp.]MDP3568027.1 outer membrane beta-barrel protein [Sediminibacterium sp.]
MKLIGFFMFGILFSSALNAQQTNATISGEVVDSIARKGLAYSTVSIVQQKDSTLVSFARADSSGKFKLSGLPKGNYLLSFSYVGYVPVWKPIQIKDAEQLNLGRIILTDLIHAGDVTVTARRPPVIINNDTIEFNTENFKTQPNAVVEDLLKKLPGVTVDRDGTVKVNGQKVNRFMVNGKEFFTGDPKIATKNLDADAIDKVQVYDRKSDQASFTGIEDGQTEKAINLKLKKDRNNSTFGRVTVGGGNKDRYEGQTNINRFNGDKQMSIIGMGNNANKQGFSIGDVVNFTGELARGMRNGVGINLRTSNSDDAGGGLPITGMGPNQQGIAQTFAGGLNYNNNWNKRTDLNINGILSDVNLQTDRTINRRNLLPGNTFDYTANSSNINHNKQKKISAILDQKIDSSSSIRFTPQLTIQNNIANSASTYQSINDQQVKLNEGSTNLISQSNAVNFNGNLLYRKKFKKSGRTISSNMSLAYNDSKQDGNLTTINRFYNAGIPLPDSITKQINNRDAITNNIGGNIIYTEGIGLKSLLEFSTFYNISTGESKRNTFDFNNGNGKYDQVNNLLSNHFRSVYIYGGGGLNFRSNFKKLSLTTGANLQVASLESVNKTNSNTIKQTFTDVLPMLSVQFKLKPSVSLGINYNTSTNQPSTQQLQPVADISDPLNTYTGNPNLRRSYTQSLAINFSSFNLYTQRNVFSFLSYSRINNAFVNSDRILPNGSRITMPVNADGNSFLVGNFNAGFPLKKLKSRVDIGLSGSSFRNISFINDQKNTIDNIILTPNIGYQFSLDTTLEIHLTARVNINQAKYSLQPQLNNRFFQQVYGLDITNFLPKGFVLNNTLDYTINTGRADGFNTIVPFWNISLAKSFLKYKKGELKFTVLDVLNKNIGINRTANQNFIQDTRYNVLQRYFLLSFSYRLNRSSSGNSPNIIMRSF